MNASYIHYFSNAPVVALIHNMVLKKAVDAYGDIRYGLFDPTHNILVSYLHLNKEPNFYQVGMPSTDPRYRRQGWATYLYDYAVLTDGLTIASDMSQTEEAKQLWLALIRNNRYEIFTLNVHTGEKLPYDPANSPWDRNNQKHTILITEQFSQELLEQIEQMSCKRGDRALRRKLGRDYLYGVGTSSDLFENI